MSFDIWTLGFQAVNVLVLIWLLQRFFWTPVAAMIATRKQTAADLLAKAQTALDDANHKKAEITAEENTSHSKAEDILAKARDTAKVTKDDLLKQAQTAADDLATKAQAARAKQAADQKKTDIQNSSDLAVTIATKLMTRLDGALVEQAFFDWLIESISTLTDAQRSALSAVDALELIAAKMPDKTTQLRLLDDLAQALGRKDAQNIQVRDDPSLIAGYELHSAHFSLANSWAADLAQIKVVLTNPDDGAVKDAP